MKDNIVNIRPSDDFKLVAVEAMEEVDYGLIIGCNKDGDLLAYGGGAKMGRSLRVEDFLWLVELFKTDLLSDEHEHEHD